MPSAKDALILFDGNIAGEEQYWFSLRQCAAEHLFDEVFAHLATVQELVPDNLETFERNGLTFALGDAVNKVHNAIGYLEDRLQPYDRGMLFFTESGKPGVDWGAEVERGAHWMAFDDTQTHRKLVVLNTQFDNKSPESRAKSMRRVLEFFAGRDEEQQLLCGDLNMSIAREHPNWPSWKRQPYYDALAAGFQDPWQACTPERHRPRMFHHYQGRGCGEDLYGTYDTDYVLAKGMQPYNIKLLDKDYGGVDPSDHFWLLAHLGPVEQ